MSFLPLVLVLVITQRCKNGGGGGHTRKKRGKRCVVGSGNWLFWKKASRVVLHKSTMTTPNRQNLFTGCFFEKQEDAYIAPHMLHKILIYN